MRRSTQATVAMAEKMRNWHLERKAFSEYKTPISKVRYEMALGESIRSTIYAIASDTDKKRRPSTSNVRGESTEWRS